MMNVNGMEIGGLGDIVKTIKETEERIAEGKQRKAIVQNFIETIEMPDEVEEVLEDFLDFIDDSIQKDEVNIDMIKVIQKHFFSDDKKIKRDLRKENPFSLV